MLFQMPPSPLPRLPVHGTTRTRRHAKPGRSSFLPSSAQDAQPEGCLRGLGPLPSGRSLHTMTPGPGPTSRNLSSVVSVAAKRTVNGPPMSCDICAARTRSWVLRHAVGGSLGFCLQLFKMRPRSLIWKLCGAKQPAPPRHTRRLRCPIKHFICNASCFFRTFSFSAGQPHVVLQVEASVLLFCKQTHVFDALIFDSCGCFSQI